MEAIDVKITTARLEIVPATLAMVQAELNSHADLASMLEARIPAGWPPGEYDRPAIEYFKARLSEDPQNAGWYGWYAILRPGASEPRTVVGAGGFFGPPTADHTVEVGYSIVSSFEGQGYATELVRALVQHAFSTGQVNRIIAHTTSTNIGSVKVLEKAGFHRVGSGKDARSVEYARENQTP